MPAVVLYIRQEDYEAYKAITDKPKWLHNAIITTWQTTKNDPGITAANSVSPTKPGVIEPRQPSLRIATTPPQVNPKYQGPNVEIESHTPEQNAQLEKYFPKKTPETHYEPADEMP